MGTQQKLTTERVVILLWLKALDDFKGEGFEDSSFNEKYQAFEAVEDTGFSRDEYDKCVDFWIGNKVIKEDSKTHELSITKQGKKLFELIEEAGAKEDSEIKEILQARLEQTSFDRIVKYVKEHPQEAISIIGLCLQGAQIFISIF